MTILNIKNTYFNSQPASSSLHPELPKTQQINPHNFKSYPKRALEHCKINFQYLKRLVSGSTTAVRKLRSELPKPHSLLSSPSIRLKTMWMCRSLGRRTLASPQSTPTSPTATTSQVFKVKPKGTLDNSIEYISLPIPAVNQPAVLCIQGGRRQGRSLKMRRTPRSGAAGRDGIATEFLQKLGFRGSPPLPPAPRAGVTKKHQNFGQQKNRSRAPN